MATLQAAGADVAETERYRDMRELPPFDPDLDTDPPPAAVVALRGAIGAADAVLWCTPEYAGALPGPFVNLLDWTIGDPGPRSLYGKPVAWINVSASPTRAAGAHASLRTVLGYAHASIVDPACREVPVTRAMVGPDGLVAGPARTELLAALRALVDAVA
jgi:NAD(P)H-dependent FMN reductase